jgi:cobalt/nickel transport system permease protein
VLGPTAGALFVRSFERGERVHLAMVSRGYAGRIPTGPQRPVPAEEWVIALVLPVAASVVLLAGLMLG